MEAEDRNFYIDLFDGQYSDFMTPLCMWSCIHALGLKPFKDGEQWCFLYGDNIQEGIAGFGDTIEAAAIDFYTNIQTEKAKK